MSHPAELSTKIAHTWPPPSWAEVNVLVAVSGGRDSVALLRALCELQPPGSGQIFAAHLNHGLRAAESDADEQFVRDLCKELAVPLDVQQAPIDRIADADGDGIEAAARRVRYEFLEDVAAKRGARYVATAHTADDQVETILHRILRGTGIAGLSGMSLTRPLNGSITLVRPLLHVRRVEVDELLAAKSQPYREDSSNADLQFTRNRLRRDLLPKLRAEYNPGVDDALLRLGTLAGECQRVIDNLVDHWLTEAVTIEQKTTTLKTGRLCLETDYLIREVMMRAWRDSGFSQQGMGKREWGLLAEMTRPHTETTKRDFPGPIRAEKKGEQLVLTRLDDRWEA